jgi:mycothiol synthase
VTGPSAPLAEEPRSPSHISEGPLSPGQSALVLELAEAARRADGVAPLSEHVLLHVRHGAQERSRDLLLTAGGTVAGYAHLDPADEAGAGDTSGELVVHPAHRRRGHGTALIEALTAGSAGAAGAAGHGIRLWAHGDLAAAAALAQSAGFTRVRALWQMRMSLAGPPIASPVLPAGVTLRTFRPGQDEEAWLRVNRRAFAHHPEQGSWTMADLELREAEPWFDPAGFFLAERDGELAGFHWTKVHDFPAGGNQPDLPVGRNQPDLLGGSPIGEVYVVGVDPAAQAGGLGRALTLAGLAYLQDRGLDQVMLYVDESNTPAVKMYAALGFALWHTDVMYQRALAALRKRSGRPAGRRARRRVRSARAARRLPRPR